MSERETTVKNIKLLQDSITHWQRVKMGLEPGDAEHCPVCEAYTTCGDCPVGGEGGCFGSNSPYRQWVRHQNTVHDCWRRGYITACDLCRDLAQDEIVFLEGVLAKWEAKLKAFDDCAAQDEWKHAQERKRKDRQKEIEAAEKGYIWLLRDGEIEKVFVDNPRCMEAVLKGGGKYDFYPYRELTLHAKDEGVTWFRSEEEALEAQEKAKKAFVWVLRDDKIEKVQIHSPSDMERAIAGPWQKYGLRVTPQFCLHAKDEGVTWFRSEEAAAGKAKWRAAVKWDSERILAKGRAEEDKKTQGPDALISLREAKRAVREVMDGKVDSAWRDFPPRVLANNTLEIAVANLDALPRHPNPGKMVEWEKVEAYLRGVGFSDSVDTLAKRLGVNSSPF